MANISIKRHILDFVTDHDARLDFKPTKSELRKMFAGQSDDVDLHLEQLEREGLLEFGKGDDETVYLPRLLPRIKRMGVRGPSIKQRTLSEGIPPSRSIALDLHDAGIALDGNLIGHIVGDDSMIDAGLRTGDIAICRDGAPERGEIAAIEVSGQIVLRRYVIVSGIPHFLAENPVRPDLIVGFDQIIHGVLTCVVCTDPNGLGRILPPIKTVSYTRDGSTKPESMFVSMLKAEASKIRKPESKQTASISVSKTRGTTRKKSGTVKPLKKGAAHSWPKPPSGIALNDKRGVEYASRFERLKCDEQPGKPFGWFFTQALAELRRADE